MGGFFLVLIIRKVLTAPWPLHHSRVPVHSSPLGTPHEPSLSWPGVSFLVTPTHSQRTQLGKMQQGKMQQGEGTDAARHSGRTPPDDAFSHL